MPDASYLLFENLFSGAPLFKNQLDLAQHLLTTPPYFVSSQDVSELAKAQNRLKTYISQLLSESAIRTITEDFKTALKILLKKKISDPVESEKYLHEILEDLKIKNSPLIRSDIKYHYKNPIQSEISNANYIVVISANPVDHQISKTVGEFSLIHFFVEDVMRAHVDKQPREKLYRFNFPMRAHCEIFWSAFENLLLKYLDPLIDQDSFVDILYNENFIIKSATHTLYELYKKSEDQTPVQKKKSREILLQVLASNIVELLNRNKIVMTYLVTEPIFSVPLIALDPNDFSSGKLYLQIEDEFNKTTIVKSSDENRWLWKMFVWERIKASTSSRNILSPTMNSENLKTSQERNIEP